MDRRNKLRLDLELICRIAPGTILSRPLNGLTHNVSRDGMLIRWNSQEPLPLKGSPLVVEVELPEGFGFGPRLMRCNTTVVRIEGAAVGLQINNMRFVVANGNRSLADMPGATELVN